MGKREGKGRRGARPRKYFGLELPLNQGQSNRAGIWAEISLNFNDISAHLPALLLLPDSRAEYCDDHVCVSVRLLACLFVHEHNCRSTHVANDTKYHFKNTILGYIYTNFFVVNAFQ